MFSSHEEALEQVKRYTKENHNIQKYIMLKYTSGLHIKLKLSWLHNLNSSKYIDKTFYIPQNKFRFKKQLFKQFLTAYTEKSLKGWAPRQLAIWLGKLKWNKLFCARYRVQLDFRGSYHMAANGVSEYRKNAIIMKEFRNLIEQLSRCIDIKEGTGV